VVKNTFHGRRPEEADTSTSLREQLDRDSNARQPPVALESFCDGLSSSYDVRQMEISSRDPFWGGNTNFKSLSGEQLVHPQAVNFSFVLT
jgi:hypothetical protein